MSPANIASVIAPPFVKFVHLTGTPRAFAKFFFCMSSRLGLGHSRKYATLTSFAAEFTTEIDIENHDTIGILCLDARGELSGSCTTSGLAYKMKGRVGDSPIIGSGLFVDNEVGAATATVWVRPSSKLLVLF